MNREIVLAAAKQTLAEMAKFVIAVLAIVATLTSLIWVLVHNPIAGLVAITITTLVIVTIVLFYLNYQQKRRLAALAEQRRYREELNHKTL